MSASALAVEESSSRPVLVAVTFRPNEEWERRLLQLRLTVVLQYVLRRREYFEQMSRMVEAMMPLTPVPLPVEALQARRNAEFRANVLREFGALTSAQVGEWAGSKSPNRAALAHKWKSERRIFSVPHQGTNYFLGFQFDAEGQPLPVIADVIRILHELSPWELAGWFTRNDGYLGGRRAVELLTSEPARVIFAAEREAEGVVF
ncbi:MAG TPA: hypothetical protein VF266_00770 [Thermoanaerobaculia bacterium]